MNVHIYCYDDLDFLKEAVASVKRVLGDVPIHVCDGRYALFQGDTNLTPGLSEFCGRHPLCHYHAPPEEFLPFGHHLDVPTTWRPANHAKAKWVFDEVLPPDEWTLKLDADERLTRFDLDVDDLDPVVRYAPVIERQDGERLHVARLWKPMHWTPWINDCLLVRDLWPRGTPLEIRQRLWNCDDFKQLRFTRLGLRSEVEIENRDQERSANWLERRVAHLEAIGRDDRAAEVRNAVPERSD